MASRKKPARKEKEQWKVKFDRLSKELKNASPFDLGCEGDWEADTGFITVFFHPTYSDVLALFRRNSNGEFQWIWLLHVKEYEHVAVDVHLASEAEVREVYRLNGILPKQTIH